MVQMARNVESDVLVIGAGGAGLRAAIEAAGCVHRVAVVSRSMLGKAHTTMAEGGLNAVLGTGDPADSIESHYTDTLTEGAGLNDRRMVRLLVEEAAERVRDLESYGAVFDRSPTGAIAQRPFGGQGRPRTCYAGDETGHEVMLALADRVLTEPGIEMIEETIVTRLIVHDGKCAGAFAVDTRSGDYLVLRARATVLATGGACGIYLVTSNPEEATGDGMAMAYEAGAELMDMEQVQFHPTGMTWPESVRGSLVTEAARGEGGVLLNSQGERFMSRYDERMELAPRDTVTRAIWSEVQAGRGTPTGGVYLDLTAIDRAVTRARLPRTCSQFMTFQGLDASSEPLEVAPTAHHFMGGIRVRAEDNRSTTLPGLYVAGEAEAGVHGGNRIGGNALAETQVFGARAGRSAAEAVKNAPLLPAEEDLIALEGLRLDSMFRSGEKPQSIRREIRKIMWERAGIVRDSDGLLGCLERLRHLRERAIGMGVMGSKRCNPEWHDAISVHFMLVVSEAVVRSALMREESRGAHFRSDRPDRDDSKWLANVVVRREAGGGMQLEKVPSIQPGGVR